jgi:hypothetical protein
MKLSDLVSALSPTELTQISLVLFIAVFVAVLIRHGGKKRAAEHAACAALPLENDR